MAKQLSFVEVALGIVPVHEQTRACRKSVKRKIEGLSAAERMPAVIAARELILRRCRSCGGCWMARL